MAGEEAVLFYMKWWMEQPEEWQVQCVTRLVGRFLVCEGSAQEPTHCHFLSSMVALFAKMGKIKTQAPEMLLECVDMRGGSLASW